MFGASYSRRKFWLITILSFIMIGLPFGFFNVLSSSDEGASMIANILILILTFFLINTLANRIRNYGSNPWLALWSLLPLVGLFQSLYFGFRDKK